MRNITVFGGSYVTPPLWSQFCEDTANDISSRLKFPEFTNCNSSDAWGPQPNNYPPETIPLECDAKLWQQKRVLRVAQYVVSLNINYCHHHTPGWLAPDTAFFRQKIVNDSGVCSNRGENATNQWIGIDCSTYSSFIYNFGLGTHLTKDIKKQGCSLDSPGRVLNVSNLTLSQKTEFFEPGDLLYIGDNIRITHVIMWTGYKLTKDDGPFGIERIIKNYPSEQRSWIQWEAAKSFKNNYPIYIITDSARIGPDYRLFIGWYRGSFKYARRLIDPPKEETLQCF
jgi:hypothetical protein